MFGKIIATIIGGLIAASLGAMVIGLPFANNPEASSQVAPAAFGIVWLLVAVLSFTAKTGGKAWRRALLLSAVLAFLLPLASFLFAGVSVSEVAINADIENSAAAAAGAVIGGGIMTMISGFLGFFMGVVFLVIGFSVGKDKEVIIVRDETTS